MAKKEKQEIVDVETALNDLNDQFNNGEGVEISGRVYRINSPKDSVGRPTFEAVAKVTEFVDEDWIGRNFGGGQYRIKYTITDDEKRVIKQLNYNVGHEYDKFLKQTETAPKIEKPAAFGGIDFGAFIGSLTVDKVAAITAGLKALKEFLAPPPPPPQNNDLIKLFEIMAANSNKSSVSEAIVLESMRTMKEKATQPPAPAPSFSQTIADYNALKELFEKNNNDADEGGEMNFLLEKAFEYLPLLLQKNNNNYRAVGQEVKENPFVSNLIRNDPDLAQKFFERARVAYGDENAKNLAAGFGLKMDIVNNSEVPNEPN